VSPVFPARNLNRFEASLVSRNLVSFISLSPEVSLLNSCIALRLVVIEMIGPRNRRPQGVEVLLIDLSVSRKHDHLMARQWEVMVDQQPPVVATDARSGWIYHYWKRS